MKTLFITFYLLLIALINWPQTPKPVIDYTEKDLHCMAQAVYHEARGEPRVGQAAVAHVVLNRKQSGQFSKSICGVVYQPHQFTDITKTKPNKASEAWKKALLISESTLLGISKDPTKGAKYFYAHQKVKPKWSVNKDKLILGNHTFL